VSGAGLGQAVEQGVNAGTRCAQARFKRITLLAQGVHLTREQGIGALQLFITQKQALDALGYLVGGVGWLHGACIVSCPAPRLSKGANPGAYNSGVGARAVVHTAQFNGKQEGKAVQQPT